MLAVVAVILDHLLAWPSGGFVGVDVFFVISGFLITGILIREHERDNHISFVGFYRRRIKRIIPAATVVLILTVLAAWAWFNSARYVQTFWDAVYAFFFSANWHFAAAGTDYFQATGPVSPLQHFWSLSVEEQFYFVWPWLMLGVLALAGLRRGFTRRRTLTGAVMAVIVVVTFTWAMFETTSNPTVAYFSTFTRAWELGFGALLAIASPWWSRIPSLLRPIMGWIGLLAILGSYFVINDSLPFPAPWAALPVVATGLVIVAGTGGEQRALWPLTNPVSFYIGNISYSLYLWHFPIIIFAGVLLAEGSPLYYVIIVTLIVGLSIASYQLVEMPLQKIPLLDSFTRFGNKRQRRRARRDAWRQWRADWGPSYKWGGSALIAAVSLGVMAVALVPPSTPNAPPIAVPQASETAAATAAAEDTTGPATTELQAQIATAVQQTTWPELDPTMDAVLSGPQVPPDIAPCGDVDTPAIEDCTWGPETATKTAVLVGDSTSLAYTQAFIGMANASGDWRIETRAMFGCPFVDIEIANNVPEVVANCASHNAESIAFINETAPDLVVVTDTYETRTNNQTQQDVTSAEWKTGLGSLVSQIAPNVGHVTFLAPPPSSANVQSCYSNVSSPQDCMTTVKQSWTAAGAAESALATEIGATWVDTRRLFCAESYCPAFVGSTPVKVDLVHITSAYADKVAPAMRETFQELGYF
jgi:peptidoglycan/LPS O-acetylase OafA/YrhL